MQVLRSRVNPGRPFISANMELGSIISWLKQSTLHQEENYDFEKKSVTSPENRSNMLNKESEDTNVSSIGLILSNSNIFLTS